MTATDPRKGDGPLTVPSERGGARWILLLWLALLVGLAVAGYAYRDALKGTKLAALFSAKQEPGAEVVYYCPMHPQIQSDKPGTCPICNMNLEVKKPEQAAPAPKQASGDKVVYYCPMHPQIQSDKPGTCPICNMNLEVKKPEQAAPASKQASGDKVVYYCPMHPQIRSDKPGTCPICNMNLEKMEGPGAPGETASGTVHISPQKQQLIGIQLSEVTLGPLASTVRAVGRLAYNESKIARIQTKFEGWAEQVFVDFTGTLVKKGQPLVAVYSPQLFATQRELIVARKSMDALADSPFEEVASGSKSLYEATRQRLRLWDLSDAQIREIEKKGTPSRSMTLFSPLSGFVVTKNVVAGQRITPEMELYTVADLSSIWVLADVYEYEVPKVKTGQDAVMTLAYQPGKTYQGKVSYIYPDLDRTTRTLRVRLDFPNPGFELKPDMYANVDIRVDHGSGLSVPQEAVLDSGLEQIVFVALGEGTFEPRKVRLGVRVGDRFVVLDGLKAGEKVVTAGNFLVDSESQLKAAFRSLAGSPPEGGGGGTGAGAHRHDQ